MQILLSFWLTEALILIGLVVILQRFRASRSYALILGFVLFGLLIGILAATLWPLDTSVYFNPLAVWAGDWLYVHTIGWIGDPYSDQAGYTIPWLVRVPQVYVLVSFVLYGTLGVVIQWLYLQWVRRAMNRRVILQDIPGLNRQVGNKH